jgi:hypothetical protein
MPTCRGIEYGEMSQSLNIPDPVWSTKINPNAS